MSESNAGAQKILIVATSCGQMGDEGEETGVWLEELAVPFMLLREAGVEVEVASIKGGRLPIDPRSREDEPSALVEKFLGSEDGKLALEQASELRDVEWQSFDGVFFPGGHGAMWDLPDSELVGRIVARYLVEHKPVAAVCHGAAALVSARDADKKPVVAGRTVNSFSDSEEEESGFMGAVPFALEGHLRELGASVETGPNFESFAVRDGCLITGQNPASSKKVAELLLQALSEKWLIKRASA